MNGAVRFTAIRALFAESAKKFVRSTPSPVVPSFDSPVVERRLAWASSKMCLRVNRNHGLKK